MADVGIVEQTVPLKVPTMKLHGRQLDRVPGHGEPHVAVSFNWGSSLWVSPTLLGSILGPLIFCELPCNRLRTSLSERGIPASRNQHMLRKNLRSSSVEGPERVRQTERRTSKHP